MGAAMGASVPLPTKVKRPLHHKKRTSPARSGSTPMSQREGTSRTVSPEECTSSQGMTPATLPAIKAMKKSDRRTPMKILLSLDTYDGVNACRMSATTASAYLVSVIASCYNRYEI